MNKNELIEIGNKLFNEEVNRLALDDVQIRFVNNLKGFYARNIPSKDFNSFVVEINLYQLIRNHKNDEVNLYRNIIHELEHVKTLSYPKEPDYYNYDQIYALMEYMSMINKNTFYKDQILKMNVRYRIQLGQLMVKNYQFSRSEIIANLESLKKVIKNYQQVLTEEDLKTYQFLIESYSILKDTTILRYDLNNNGRDGLPITYCAVSHFIKKNPIILDSYQSLRNIFNEKGEFKDIYEMYQSINDDNRDFIEKTIIDILLINNINLNYYLDDESFKNYLSDIIANYNNRIFKFYENFDMLNELYTKKNKKNPYLFHNFRFLKNHTLILASYINNYGLDIKSGMIIDNSAVPNVLKKIR